jgi:CheY-like chemotaxis protein
MTAAGDEAMTRVLVIDDEAPIRLLCRVNLEAEGMDVLEAADGPTGLEQAREERPDIVLLDVMMPGLDGWHVAEALLSDERTRDIPIIFLTARAEFRDRARAARRETPRPDRSRRARRAARREARRAPRADGRRLTQGRRVCAEWPCGRPPRALPTTL